MVIIMKLGKHTKMIFAGVVFFALAAAELSLASDGLEKYRSIIERRPFGTVDKPPPRSVPKEAKATPAPPQPELAKLWRLSTITVIPNLGIRVGLRNKKTKDSYFVGVGDSAGEIKILDADYEQEKVLIQQGSTKEWIVMEGVGIRAGSATQAETDGELKRGTSRQEYAQRVAARRKALSRHRKVEPPKLQGDELKEHLRKLNMKYIREGMPPLPIQLTPEEDAELVQEGVLPERQ